MFNPLLQRVFMVNVRGPINQKLTNRILIGFKKAFLFKPLAILVSINSVGGSVTQANYISDLLKKYSKDHNIPIYCFGEDQCLNSANIILTTGVKCYTNEMTLIGDYGYSWNPLWLKKFGDRFNVRQEYITAGQNKVKFNRFQDLKAENQKWMQNYMYLLEHQLKLSIINNRKQKLQKLNMDTKGIEQVFSKGIITPEVAIKSGLIDGVMNSDELLHDKFPNQKLYFVNKSKNESSIRSRLMELIM